MRICSMALCLLLAGTTAATAQQPAAVGVKVGVNSANLLFDADGADVSFDRRTGLVGGLFVIVPANRTVALQVEGLYSQLGAAFDEEEASGKIELDYFTVPVLLRVSGPRSQRASVHAFGGPSFGIRLRARSSGAVEGESADRDISDEVERMDVGLTAGAGVDIGRITIDGRHTWGLRNINRDSGADDVKIKNRAFAVMVGVRF
jgi:hypothetical protein